MRIFLIAFATAILQVSAARYAVTGPFGLSLDIIALVFYSYKHGFKTGAALGIFFGVFSGVFSSEYFWFNAIVYTVIGAMAGYIGRWFYKDNLPAFLLMVFCSLICAHSPHMNAGFLRLFLPMAAYNLVLSVFLFYFLRML
jgi:hypothetical protein